MFDFNHGILFGRYFRLAEIDGACVRVLKMKRQEQVKRMNYLKQVFDFHLPLRLHSSYRNELIR